MIATPVDALGTTQTEHAHTAHKDEDNDAVYA